MIIVRRLNYTVLVALLAGASPKFVQAQMAPVFTYQGQLNEAGRPYNGAAYLEFTLWDALENGNQIGSAYWTSAGVPVVNGLFTVEVDAMLFGPTAFTGAQRWLQVVVTDWNYFERVELTPRQPINPAPYALYALDGSGGGSSPWDDDIEGINFQSGNVGIGTDSSANASLYISSAERVGVYARNNDSSSGKALVGAATGATGIGVYGSSSVETGRTVGVDAYATSPDGMGVYAFNEARSGNAIAIKGETGSPTGFGGYFMGMGYFSGNLGVGVSDPNEKLEVAGTIKTTGLQLTDSPMAGYVMTSDAFGHATWQPGGGGGSLSLPYAGSVIFDGEAFKVTNNGMTDAIGGSFESRGDEGVGVYGKGGIDGYGGVFEGDTDAVAGVKGSTTRDNGAGVYATADSPNGWGIYALNNATSGEAYGVFGRTQSTSGKAVWGEARGTTGPTAGVYGQARSPDGEAIVGHNAAGTGDAIGVYGSTGSPDGYAGYFEGPRNYFSGNVGIGTLFPDSPLTVDGIVESTTGGFKFPDGTIQTSAGGGGGTSLWQAWEGHIYSPTANVAIGDTLPTDSVTLRIESGPDEYPLSATASYAAAPWAITARSNAPFGVGLYAKTTDLGPSWAVYGETSGSNGWGGYFLGKGYFSGNVGIGTTDPGSPLTVAGPVESTTGGFKFPDGSIQNTAATGSGSSVWSADATGINYQSGHVGIGTSSTTTDSLFVHGSGTRAIRGINDAPTGIVNGVQGSADSTTGRGVYGHASSSSGQAVGVLGETASPDGYGVWGYNDDDSLTGKSIGVYGSSNGTRGVGVKGHVFGSGGAALWGRHDGTAGTGVLAEVGSPSGTTYGVNAYVASPTGFGVYAFNEGESGDAVAIYGESGSPTGIAGYFDGRGYFRDNVGIGTTTPGSKLSVNGIIESTSTGFKFPDGTVQTTAAASSSSLWQTNGTEIYYDSGNIGVGIADPQTTLHVAGGNWDVANTEGDFKIGSGTYRLKMGVATGGIGAGSCRIFAGGPSSKLTLGASGTDRLVVTNSLVDVIGTLETDGFKLTAAPAAGFVLTSDASGNGSWQSPTGGGGSFDLPYAGSVAHTGDAFKITNTGTFMGSAISGTIQNAASSDAAAGYFSADGSGMAIHAESDGGRTIYAHNSGSGKAIDARTNGDGGGSFSSSMNGGFGVKGISSSTGTSSENRGGWFTASGTLGIGVEVEGQRYGVRSVTSKSSGCAVRAEATGADSTGLHALSPNDGLIAEGGRYAGRFFGKVVVHPHGGGAEIFAVNNDGTTQVNVLQIMGGADLSEQFDITADNTSAEPGMVVCIDPAHPGKLVVCEGDYDRTVAGIISGAGGIGTGMMMGQTESIADGAYPVALTGRVYVHADASHGSITPGDMLTTSDVPGHAMKVADHGRAQGATLGKAMTSLESGRGLVLVLVTLQ